MKKFLHLLKTVIRRSLPTPLIDRYRLIRYRRTWYEPKGKPVREVFAEIYRRRLCDGGASSNGDGRFYSGPGSDLAVSAPYVEAVQRVIREYNITSIADLGCGDFRVGLQLVQPGLSYHGIDVVKDLVEFNTGRFASSNVCFSCRDIIEDELPVADLCLIRQVLQHLSNQQVQRVLKRCEQYPFVIVTQHLPSRSFTWEPNLDIEHGFETRIDFGSGLVLDQPPFNRAIKQVLCEVQLVDDTLIQSVLLVNKDARNLSQ